MIASIVNSCFLSHCPALPGIWHIYSFFCYFELFFYRLPSGSSLSWLKIRPPIQMCISKEEQLLIKKNFLLKPSSCSKEWESPWRRWQAGNSMPRPHYAWMGGRGDRVFGEICVSKLQRGSCNSASAPEAGACTLLGLFWGRCVAPSGRAAMLSGGFRKNKMIFQKSEMHLYGKILDFNSCQPALPLALKIHLIIQVTYRGPDCHHSPATVLRPECSVRTMQASSSAGFPVHKCRYETHVGCSWDASMDKGACCQAWWPEFDCWDPHGGRRDQTLRGCPLTVTC